MTEKTRKITTFSLYALAFVCCILAAIMLLSDFEVMLEETIYAVPPGEKRTEITSETEDYSKNFFDYISYLEFKGWKPTIEIMCVITLILSFVISLSYLIKEIICLVFQKEILNKYVKYGFMGLTIVSLITLIIAIIIQNDSTTWKMCDYELITLSGYAGWKFYEETLVRGSVQFVPIIIFMLVAFLAQLSAVILNIIPRRNTTEVDELIECETTAFPQSEAVIKNNDPIEELSKYKKLLDEGIITQEEFDAKKKQILNI